MLTFNKTLDLVRQVRDAARALSADQPILPLLDEGEQLMRRGIVALCLGVGVPMLDSRPTESAA
jgi:hypothetical protein